MDARNGAARDPKRPIWKWLEMLGRHPVAVLFGLGPIAAGRHQAGPRRGNAG